MGADHGYRGELEQRGRPAASPSEVDSVAPPRPRPRRSCQRARGRAGEGGCGPRRPRSTTSASTDRASSPPPLRPRPRPSRRRARSGPPPPSRPLGRPRPRPRRGRRKTVLIASGPRASGPVAPLPARRATPGPFTAAMHPSKDARSAAAVARPGVDAAFTRRSQEEPDKSSQSPRRPRRRRRSAPPASRRGRPARARRARPAVAGPAGRRMGADPAGLHPKTETSAGSGAAQGGPRRSPSVADEIDAWPTQAIEGAALAELAERDGGRARAAFGALRASSPPLPRLVWRRLPAQPRRPMRVLVWRAGDGVHVAPRTEPPVSDPRRGGHPGGPRPVGRSRGVAPALGRACA